MKVGQKVVHQQAVQTYMECIKSYLVSKGILSNTEKVGAANVLATNTETTVECLKGIGEYLSKEVRQSVTLQGAHG